MEEKLNESFIIKSTNDLKLRFEALCEPFVDSDGNFSLKNYQALFYNGFLNKNYSEISQFFDKANVLIFEIIVSMHAYVPKEFRYFFAYYLDLIGLLCSEMNTKFREISADDRRAHVDIYSQSLDKVLIEMNHVYKRFKTEENFVVILPSDFCLRYNLADYVIFIFNKNYLFDLAHLYEAKSTVQKEITDPKQLERVEKQKQVNKAALNKYNKIPNFFLVFFIKETYFCENSENFKEILLKGSGELKIDDVFSVLVENDVIRHSSEFWYSPVFEESRCVNVLPLLFRNLNLKDFNFPEERGVNIYIKTNKRNLRSALFKWKNVEAVDKHDNPFQAYVKFLDGSKLSIADIIHFKLKMSCLEEIFNDLKKYSHEQHGKFSTFEINAYENKGL